MAEWMVTVGDCRDVMAGMDAESVDAIVCDPPYGLEFMGKDWDAPWKFSGTVETVYEGQDKSHPFRDGAPRVRYGTGDMPAYQAWFETVAVEALRVLKPGGHLLAFGGTRTFHRMTVAIEDAGFEVRDCLSWLYGSGFPKSLNVGKAIDKAAGAERVAVIVPTKNGNVPEQAGSIALGATGMRDVSAPVTDEAARWEGWGTALKPAWEPIVMARKPVCGTVAGNVLVHGTGGLNIDGSRVPTNGERIAEFGTPTKSSGGILNNTGEPMDKSKLAASYEKANVVGRWPANVLLDEGAAAALDEQTGVSKSSGPGTRCGRRDDEGRCVGHDNAGRSTNVQTFHGPEVHAVPDTGGASRFFHVFANDDNLDTWITNDASAAVTSSRPPSAPEGSAPNGAATPPSSGEQPESAKVERTTHGTPTPSKRNGATDTPPTLSTGSKSKPESQPPSDTPTSSPASPAVLNGQTGTTTTTPSPSTSVGCAGPATSVTTEMFSEVGATGYEPRFRYVAKASRRDRNEGLDGMPERDGGERHGHATLPDRRMDHEQQRSPSANHHPTVKPTALMRHLVKLVTPPGGLVLDPFCGSGSTGKAAVLEGFRFHGIEQDAEYADIARARIAWAEQQADDEPDQPTLM